MKTPNDTRSDYTDINSDDHFVDVSRDEAGEAVHTLVHYAINKRKDLTLGVEHNDAKFEIKVTLKEVA